MRLIRFIYGKQIDSFLSHIQGNFQIESFLRYILNYTGLEKLKEGEKAFYRETNDYVNEYNKYNSESFSIIQAYLISLFNKNNSSIDDHYRKISIKKGNDDNKLKGIYNYIMQSPSMEEDIVQIFLDKLGKLPIAQNILIPSEETSEEEMQAFFNRAILCENNTLFVVEVNDSLSKNLQRKMNTLVYKLLKDKINIFNEKNDEKIYEKIDHTIYMDSCLVFIYNKDTESFLNEINKLKPANLCLERDNHEIGPSETNSLSSKSLKFDHLRLELLENTHVIESEICGLGKSTKIRNEIKKSKKQNHYFPLGGILSKNRIYKRLENIMKNIKSQTKDNFKDISIHLDLFETEQHSLLNEFLFSFLITKFYSNGENIIYIPTNIEIYVEIPNCFKDFITKYGILKFFRNEENIIKLNNLPDFILPKDKIDLLNNMLGLKDNMEIFNWIKKIFKEINIKSYSYHQIHIFLNLFICQYNIFNGEKIYFYEGNKNTTDKCINYFSKSTKYFIYGGFSKLLLEKKIKINNEEEEKNLLSKEYDNDIKNQVFDEKLIFIVKYPKPKGKNLGKYYNLDISNEALENGEGLWKLKPYEIEEREKLKKKLTCEKFEKFELLSILKKILDLKNPVKAAEGEDKGNLKSLLEIVGDDYVMTIDNFRKMILILYRIIANVPVILMGETGCGKTTLIKKLNQLLNNGKEKVKIIKIDSSYTDQDFIEKMDTINKEAKNSKKELWVFFDELNTCDSLAIITEIFINRTYGPNNKLENNIRLIGACNPYRKKKENKNICGLTYYNENDSGLVYLVNNLPQSLMYYVFNFGSLDKANEDKYISSIISDIIEENNLKEDTRNVISKCHEYLREVFDPSVVSLREVVRFKKIYKFFMDYFKNKKKLNKKIIEKNEIKEKDKKNKINESNEIPKNNKKKNKTIKLKSIIISIYLNYYIRLVDGKTRSKFDGELKDFFKQLVNYEYRNKEKPKNLNEDDIIINEDLKNDLLFNYDISDTNNFSFSQILSGEQDFILDNINLEKGIGKNNSLKENIFLLFTSLVTHIPLIIIGKPGSSKSLSSKLICKEMDGKYSKKNFFKLYPSVIQSYFQGSKTTTPEEVKGIFTIAKQKLELFKNNNNNINNSSLENNDLPISMILFDEMGLAERSKHNPLKTLHSFLEPDENKDKNGLSFSFVGISNWTLDAAKINRALNLSVPDLDYNLDDLKLTSISIAESINESFADKTIFKKILPNVYSQFKKNLKLLKKLTVYKQYEIQEYKYLINKYKGDENFQKIFSNIKCANNFFNKINQENNDNKEKKETKDEEIFEYDIFINVKNKLKKFLEEKKNK